MVNPVPGKKITSKYRIPGKHWSCGYHTGVDYAAPTGTPVVACKFGKVLEAKDGVSFGPSYGLSVIIDHGQGVKAVYAHLSKINVKAGDKVGAGDKIGEIGSTGNSTGPHLHLEARISPWRYANQDIDPQVLIDFEPAKKDGKKELVSETTEKKPKKKAVKKAPSKKPAQKKTGGGSASNNII
jgi:murein DD-endopeptidase MepM/ murein hydrolase activator NlpD